MSITYKKSGVDYGLMDPLKRMAQEAGKKTVINLISSDMKELPQSRGESAYVIDSGDSYLAFVMEGLGTKNLVADEMRKITGKTYYDIMANDTIGCMVNDIVTVGAKPVTIMAYWAPGSSEWFKDIKRQKDLVNGWAKACNLSGASWGGGETPTLTKIVSKETIDLAGACFGLIKPKSRLILGDKLEAGDVVILFESNGIHANGLSLARLVAKKLPRTYATKMPNGEMFGEALLKPTILYPKLIMDLLDSGIEIHYISNITGHGWRKIMRLKKPFTYRITAIPPVPEVLKFIVDQGKIDLKEAYGNFNMGAGFAVYVPEKEAQKVLKIASKHKIKAYKAGVVEKGEKQVIIEPLNITYKSEELNIRACLETYDKLSSRARYERGNPAGSRITQRDCFG
ncbi:AIR synthase-related protein [Candidatus Microgenomates bacterium]|nr:AIR synthase-related protein [Candidatus Microgenomates bacterium]